MRILLTRPREDANDFAQALHRLGHQTMIEPLLTIEVLKGPALNMGGIQATLLTSANGARALAQRTAERGIALIAVGPATAQAARDAGFIDVRESDGDGVTGLATFVARTLKPDEGTLLHVAGKAIAGDLSGTVAANGFALRREVLYEALAADSLSGALTAELAAGLIDGVAFFSPRTAALFVELALEENLEPACRNLIAFCLSDAVANALIGLHFREIRVAARPTGDALLKTFN